MKAIPIRRRRARSGWLSSMKRSPRRERKTRLWQWLLGVPLLALLAAGILLFVYISYVNPKLAQGVRVVRTEVLERVEKTLPSGGLDPNGSFLVVQIERKPIHLAAHPPEWNTVAKGDMVEVEVGGAGPTLIVYSWKRASPALP